MNEIQKAQVFRQVKQQSMGFLSRLLWNLSEDHDMFVESMRCALFGVWRHADQLKGNNNPRRLYQIALSANAAAWQRSLHDPKTKSCQAVSREKDLYRQIRKEISQAVRRVIAELPLEQSQAVVMRYIERHPWDNIADALGTTSDHAQDHVTKAVDTIKSRVNRQLAMAG